MLSSITYSLTRKNGLENFHKITNLDPSLISTEANPRIPIWLNTSKMIMDNWALGVGYNQWFVYYEKYQQAIVEDRLVSEVSKVNTTHNDPLQIVAELGIVGLLWIILFGYLLCRNCIKYFKRGQGSNWSSPLLYICICDWDFSVFILQLPTSLFSTYLHFYFTFLSTSLPSSGEIK